MTERTEHVRMVEALLFAAAEPLDNESLAARLPEGANLPEIMAELVRDYEHRGVNIVKVGGRWALRTAPDLAHLLERERTVPRRLSRAATETLAIIAYHQPATRAEIEDIRGVGISRGTLDVLMEAGWVRLRGRRRSPGRPLTYGTTDTFLEHFNLESLTDLPGVDELKRAGLLRAFSIAQIAGDGATSSQSAEGADEATDGEEPNGPAKSPPDLTVLSGPGSDPQAAP